ncbi:MAG: UDP-N-acetylmuramoyl-tripeptide--D-alanyl-D-alanine ligase [Rikenellaceae bacterium]
MATTTIEDIHKLFEQYPCVSTDTRRITPGSLFFALRGASFDGNKFALSAVRMGAAYAIVDDAELIAENPCVCSKLIYVDDVLQTLQLLAAHHRKVLNIPIIAIVGSNGKTTTKELLSAVLNKRYRVTATVGNLNNHIGVPLTLLSMTHHTEVGVVEMGANAQGEIAMLCNIATPNFGIINNIGRAHLEGFGGVDGIKKGKGELYDYLLKSEGVAFVPSDDETLISMAHDRKNLQTIEYPFSLANGIKHQLEGDFNLKNIASAVAIATYFRVERNDIEQAIAEYTPQNNRSQRTITPHNILIVDCYNANPSSMEVSIKNFVSEEFSVSKAMILGDMFELGEWSKEEHKKVIERAMNNKNSEIFLVGINFTQAFESLNIDTQPDSQRVKLFPSRKELEAHLETSPLRDKAILIKGSHSVGLEHIIKML